MGTEADPIIGNWYEHLDKGQAFEVVAIDEDNRAIEIQYFDGDLEEIALDHWYEMDIETSEPPEDWTGSIDDVERDDLGYTETDMEREDWSEPLEAFKPLWRKRDEGLEEAQDDWGEGIPEEEPWEGED